jgi:t-SNARE complex subunit (syntaxin)
MRFQTKTKYTEPEDARVAFHKSEKRHAVNNKISKWFSYLCVLITIAIIVFVIYAYFIDKSGAIYNGCSIHP